jgi:large subunit ribosomal protein L21
MYAVVEIAGTQFHVEKNNIVKTPLLQGNPGDNLEFANILVAGEGDNVNVGAPYVNGKVSARIISHGTPPAPPPPAYPRA